MLGTHSTFPRYAREICVYGLENFNNVYSYSHHLFKKRKKKIETTKKEASAEWHKEKTNERIFNFGIFCEVNILPLLMLLFFVSPLFFYFLSVFFSVVYHFCFESHIFIFLFLHSFHFVSPVMLLQNDYSL